MSQEPDNEVSAAFDILMEEVENAIEELQQEGASAFGNAAYDRARELAEKASQMTAFREKIQAMEQEWRAAFGHTTVAPKPGKKRSPAAAKRLERGLRTREDAFRLPILQALVQSGGSGTVAEVLDLVEKSMKARLNAYDRSPLPSYPTTPRWRNTAQWARNAMVKEGLLSSDSARGTWEITAQGKQWLTDHAPAH